MRLISFGPRLLSNETSQPFTVTGEGLRPGAMVLLGAPISRRVPLAVLDARHAHGRLPADLALPQGQSEAAIEVSLADGDGRDTLRLVNDQDFPDLQALALCPDGKTAFVASRPTDQVFAVDLSGRRVTALPAGDGPTALAAFPGPGGAGRVLAVHRYAPELRVYDCAAPYASTTAPGPANAEGVAVDAALGLAFVAEHARDSVVALALDGLAERWRTPVAPNPRALAPLGALLAVGSLQTGEVELLEARTGRPQRVLQPGPGTPIVGGGTAAFSKEVMNGKAPRALAWSPAQKRLFVASIGPNVGPNAAKMEVSMNGGVAAVDPSAGAWLRHLGFGAGVTQALALDDARHLLYAADVSVGLLRVLDARKLAASDAAAAKALLQEVALPPPDDFPRFRPEADFGGNGRAGLAVHSGPQALALTPDRKRLVVLNRHTGTLAVLDVAKAGARKAALLEQLPVATMLAQRTRRLGQVLYFADLGRTAMSCDACHLEGHTEGVLFEKTNPLRIYRSPTVRGSRETPPHFTPASTRSMGETARVVGSRNRFHNPDLTPAEVEALTLYASCLPTLPNPFVGADGAPVESLVLPDGRQGSPRRGAALFFGRAGCAECHPPPHYTLDQDPATRGRYLDVGTPRLMPLREKLQNPHFEGFAPPALAGAWDVFPMLNTGLAGLGVDPDGSVRVRQRFCLRPAVEGWPGRHGRADQLSDAERDDLLSFVLSL